MSDEPVPRRVGHDRHPRFVRPYVLTRGRTRGPGRSLPLEASVWATTEAGSLPKDSIPEWRRIVEMCAPPMSLAELAARLLLPVGVVRVLVSDLTLAGAVSIDDGRAVDAARDVHLLERLLDGIRAL